MGLHHCTSPYLLLVHSSLSSFRRHFSLAVRKNTHRYPSVEEEHDDLIYQYTPVYSGDTDSVFDQVYLFD